MVGTVFDRLELAHGGQASGVVGVDEHRQRLLGFQRAHQFTGGVWSQQTGHVLDRHRVATHGFHLLGLGDEGLDGVHRTGGIGDGALCVFAGSLHRFDGHAQVTHIVHRIENAEHVDAVHRCLGDESFDHVVAVMAIAEQILPAQEHLQTGVGQRRTQLAQALPRVFLEKAHTGVERRAAPAFQRPVADLVELVADRQHVFGAHSGGEQRLVSVAQDGVGNEDLLSHWYLLIAASFKLRAARKSQCAFTCRLQLKARSCFIHRPAWAAMAAAMARASSSGLRLIE